MNHGEIVVTDQLAMGKGGATNKASPECRQCTLLIKELMTIIYLEASIISKFSHMPLANQNRNIESNESYRR